MKFLSFLILSFFIPIGLFAQLILTGTVHKENQVPLAGAGLLLRGDGRNVSVAADQNGAFTVSQLKKGKYSLTVSYAGYQSETTDLILSKDTTLLITLKTSSTQLNEVIISADPTTVVNNGEKLVYNVSNSITATGADGLQAVGQVPGIKVSDNEITSAGRGQLKVMVNGRLLQLTGIDLTRYLKSMSASQISKIELIKNPSASFEADGNAGIINIITKQNKTRGYSGTVQFNAKRWIHDKATIYGTSNFFALNGNTSLNYSSEKLSVYGNLNFDEDHHLEGFRTDIYYPGQIWKQSDTGDYKYHNINLIAGADYLISPKATIGITYLGGRNVYDGSDHVNNPVYNYNGGLDSTLKAYATYYPVALSNSINMHSVISFDTTGKKLLLNADYYNYYRTDVSDFESNVYRSDGVINPSSRKRYYDTNKQNINIYTFKADMEIPTAIGSLAFGGKLSFIDNYSNAFYYDKANDGGLAYNTNLSNEFDYKENTQSLYGSLSRSYGKWKYQAGLRAEFTQTSGYSFSNRQNTDVNYLKLFPSLVVTYQPGDDNSFSITYGKRINRPSFWNLNPYKSIYTEYSYGQGNPYLQPEYNNNLEFSHIFKGNLNSSLFLNITSNGFNYVTIASADTNLVYTTPINFLKTFRYGISESYSLKTFKLLDNNNQVTFYYTNAQTENNSFKGIKGYGLYMSSSNTLYFNTNKTFGVAANFWYQFPEIDHISRTDAYYKLDLGITASAFKKELSITFNVNDVFRSSAMAKTTIVNGVRQKFTNFQINRFAQLSLNYRFGSKKETAKGHQTGNEDERGRN
ncbi:outer membrane beta-barrel family protein [Pedobacter frigoris]|uniref:outer membrane beta-barrel family protein n=1 Tax=Pedobacter frigoris TaxID=2571272 RepID=UPI002931E21D|nr:outer membrane beta-barrel family protein [Pedobacter frigoris]